MNEILVHTLLAGPLVHTISNATHRLQMHWSLLTVLMQYVLNIQATRERKRSSAPQAPVINTPLRTESTASPLSGTEHERFIIS